MHTSLLSTARSILSGLTTSHDPLDEARSHSDIRKWLRDALKAEAGSTKHVWIQDVLDDGSVVYSVSTDYDESHVLLQRSYTLDENDTITLGDPFPVRIQTEYVPVEEAIESANTPLESNLVPLVEGSSVRADGTGRIKIIQPGWGSSGYYSADVLKAAAPKFAEGTHIYIDHPSRSEAVDRPERSVRDLAGSFTSAAVWEENGSNGPGLYADVKFKGDLAAQINDIAPHVGMSIRALGSRSSGEAEGQSGMIINSIEQAESVDVVTVAGAGGAITELLESLRVGSPRTEEITLADKPEGQEATTVNISEAPEFVALQEQMAAIQAQLSQANTRNFVQDQLAEMGVADPIRKKVLPGLVVNPPLNDQGQIDHEAYGERIKEAVKAELAYIAEISGNTGAIQGMGSSFTESLEEMTPEDSQTALNEAFAAMGLPENVASIAAAGRS